MPRQTLLLTLFVALAPLAPLCAENVFPAGLIGDWEGAYVRLGAAQIVRLSVWEKDGGLRATYSVPDLAVENATPRVFSYRDGVVVLRAVHGEFTLRLDAELGELTGINARWNPPVTLHLRRRLLPFAPAYRREPLVFRNGAVRLYGQLYRPLQKRPLGAVVLIHGSGAQGLGGDHYRFWAELLPQFGIAVLAYDKRGVGESTGDFRTASLHDLAGDALAGVKALAARRDVPSDRIGLAGLSQGGWIAPIAAVRSPAVKFLLLIVAPAVSVEQQELDRVEYTLRANEFSADDIEAAVAYTRLMFETVQNPTSWPRLAGATEDNRAAAWFEHVAAPESAASLERWKKISYDPAETLAKVSVPTLAIYGEQDTLVPPERNAKRLKSLLSRGGATVDVSILANAGHNLETFGTLKGGEWGWPEKYWVWPRKSPELRGVLQRWIETRLAGAR